MTLVDVGQYWVMRSVPYCRKNREALVISTKKNMGPTLAGTEHADDSIPSGLCNAFKYSA